MQRIEPHSFSGPRAYFTNFDPRILSRNRNRDKLRLDIERRLKILLLTKNTIVCAASHLTSEFTYQLFRESPILLNKGLIIPALRRDKTNIDELFEKKKLPANLKQDMISFYGSQIHSFVNWDLEENSGWFRETYLKELKDDRSVLRKNIVNLSSQQVRHVITEIEKDPLLERKKIDLITSNLDRQSRRTMIDFRELIYHISGARVVNCESTLPQENYIDYSLADIEQRKILLSDLQIFWKIFLELAFETMIRTTVPFELIDVLSFDDISSIRKPIENSTFRDSYDRLISISVASLNKKDPKDILYNIEELMTIRERLAKEFKMAIEKELGAFMRRKALADSKGLGKTSVSIGLGVAGLFPPTSLASSVAGLALEGRAFWINLNQSFNSAKAFNNYGLYLKNKETALRRTIDKSEISNKTTLLSFVKLIMDVISKKITF